MTTTNFPCVIVDIDGTVADCEHRRKFLEQTPKRWDKFFDPDQVKRDPIKPEIANLVRLLQAKYLIVYASGRVDTLRATTETWLRKHGLYFHPHFLFMRKEGDYRSDTTVKKEILEQIKNENLVPVYSIDDRASVVSMWRENGITCLQVADGDF